MERIDVLFDTGRFNLSDVKPNFINPCCFGEDASQWLREKLVSKGVEVELPPGQEDWGWYLKAKLNGTFYFIGIGGNRDTTRPLANYGEWRVIVQKRRSFLDWVAGKNKMTSEDQMLTTIEAVLSNESDFSDIRRE